LKLRTNRFGDAARGQPKSARTRARLMDAAVRVIAERGVNAASVNEIAAVADVANGTFYNHFQDKAEIVTAVKHGIAAAIDRQMDAARPLYEDGADRVAFATQTFIDIAVQEPDWGWMMVHTQSAGDTGGREGLDYIKADVRRGIDQGRFTAEPCEFLFTAATSMIVAAIRTQLEEGLDAVVGALATEYVLVLLGMSQPDARAIVARTRAQREADCAKRP
jgi:AcrR family transcriptional regulator